MLSVNIQELMSLATTIYDRPDLPATVLTVSGESGIGKTEASLQFISKLPDYEPPRVINVAHLNIEDLGMPTNGNPDFVDFKLSRIFEVQDKLVLILLDELNRPNNDTVINFLMGAVAERRLFGKPLSDKVRFMATLNPNNENYPETRDIFSDLAARRRFNQIELRFDQDQFMRYSAEQNMHSTLHSFLVQNPEHSLISGKINCPRQWHRFNKDILSSQEYQADDIKDLKIASSLYMDPATLSVWLKYWEGSLESFIRASDILKDLESVIATIHTQLSKNKIDLLAASCNDLRNNISNRSKITTEQFANLSRFLLMIPKSMAFTVIEDLVQNAKCKDIIKRYLFSDAGLMDLIKSGTSA